MIVHARVGRYDATFQNQSSPLMIPYIFVCAGQILKEGKRHEKGIKIGQIE